jgi:hypothetical protein
VVLQVHVVFDEQAAAIFDWQTSTLAPTMQWLAHAHDADGQLDELL